LIQEFRGKKFEEWEEWYLQKHPDAIKNAKEKILNPNPAIKAITTILKTSRCS
jgi:hypothetical protein